MSTQLLSTLVYLLSVAGVLVAAGRASGGPESVAHGHILLQEVSATDIGLQRRLKQQPGADGLSTRSAEHHHQEPQSPFHHCRQLMGKLTAQHTHQLRGSFQHFHSAYARYVYHKINWENFQLPSAPNYMQNDKPMAEAFIVVYKNGKNGTLLQELYNEANSLQLSMEARIKAELKKLTMEGLLPTNTSLEALSPCIMRKINQDDFPDQPQLSLLMRIPAPSAQDTDVAAVTASVQRLVDMAKACRTAIPALELVVSVGVNASLAHHEAWAWQSWNSSGFVVPYIDPYDVEAFAFNRMAALARGRVVVVLTPEELTALQADSQGKCDWLAQLEALYHRIPQMVALGANGQGQPFKEPSSSAPFQYALLAEGSPASFRRAALEEVSWADEDMPGESGACSSWTSRDLSLRLWKAGWRVGAHRWPYGAPAALPGDSAPGCPAQSSSLSLRLFEDRHGTQAGPLWPALLARVKELNIKALTPMSGSVDQLKGNCPMPQGCDAP